MDTHSMEFAASGAWRTCQASQHGIAGLSPALAGPLFPLSRCGVDEPHFKAGHPASVHPAGSAGKIGSGDTSDCAQGGPFSSSCHDLSITCRGLCPHCGEEHSLPVGLARAECHHLMTLLEAQRRIDFLVPEEQASPRFRTDYLYGPARGQMFGVLVCRTSQGALGVLRAFSGQYNSEWSVPGWVPPIVDIQAFNGIVARDDARINAFTRRIAEAEAQGDHAVLPALKEERKALSRRSMADVHALYQVASFRGDSRLLTSIFPPEKGIPTGTGECCAPKLLHFAALHGLEPIGLAEFYWGRENRSGTRQHGQLYPSCMDKCYPLLGYMLCGLNTGE